MNPVLDISNVIEILGTRDLPYLLPDSLHEIFQLSGIGISETLKVINPVVGHIKCH